MRTRLIVCPLIKNSSDEYLICKMPADRGAYPGQWGIPGGGVEPGEKIIDTLLREVREEIGGEIELTDITPWTFSDAVRTKLYPDGTSEEIYMVYLIYDCTAVNDKIILNDEFEEYNWVKLKELSNYNLNEATRQTFDQKRLDHDS